MSRTEGDKTAKQQATLVVLVVVGSSSRGLRANQHVAVARAFSRALFALVWRNGSGGGKEGGDTQRAKINPRALRLIMWRSIVNHRRALSDRNVTDCAC